MMSAEQDARIRAQEYFFTMMTGAEKMLKTLQQLYQKQAIEDTGAVPSRLLKRLHDLIIENQDAATPEHKQRLIDLLITTSAIQHVMGLDGEITKEFLVDVVMGATFFLGAHAISELMDNR